ncbi:unnamed protein product, partial [Rotaria magnacalcarata]
LCGHSELLVIALNLIQEPAPKFIQVVKNLRVCGHCHEFTKVIAKIEQCDIVVRDANRIHHFYPNGQLFINIVPVTMQSISIQIEDLEQLLMKFADRLFGIVDPTINKFRNVTFEIISELENRIEVNTSEVFYRSYVSIDLIRTIVINTNGDTQK